MNTLTTVLAILVALEHLYIMFLETIATSSESTSRVFSISVDQLKSKTIATLLKNQEMTGQSSESHHACMNGRVVKNKGHANVLSATVKRLCASILRRRRSISGSARRSLAYIRPQVSPSSMRTSERSR